MRLEDMKSDIPETPDFIHKMIQNEVAKQIQDTKVMNLQRRKTWTIPKIAAVAAACTLAVSTAAYAGVNLYHWFLEKQGAYGVAVKIDADSMAKETMLPDEVPEVNLFARYIPKGMSWNDEYHLQYPEHEQTGGFSFASVLLDKDDVSKEDAIKVAENLVITGNTTMVKTAGMPTWSEDMIAEKIENDDDEIITSVNEKELPVYQIGDTFDLNATGEDTNGEYLTKTISAKVDSIQIADDLQLLEPDKIPEEWTEAIGADGKLSANTLNYVKSGDGINSLDEIVKSEAVNQKLVYATVTYTNNSDEEIDHMLYLGALLTMTKENGRVQIYVPTEQSGDGYDRITWDGMAKTGEMVYYNVSENYGNGGNYISSIKPDESVQLNMAWIVNENDLENLYLNVTGDGASYEFSENILKNGLVDIRK